jgi:hypothetical protein
LDTEGTRCECKCLCMVSFWINRRGQQGQFLWVAREDAPELCVTTPLSLPPAASHSLSANNLSNAWKAPRTLNAPTFCRFSHLNHNRIVGQAGIWPSHGVPTSAEGS